MTHDPGPRHARTRVPAQAWLQELAESAGRDSGRPASRCDARTMAQLLHASGPR